MKNDRDLLHVFLKFWAETPTTFWLSLTITELIEKPVQLRAGQNVIEEEKWSLYTKHFMMCISSHALIRETFNSCVPFTFILHHNRPPSFIQQTLFKKARISKKEKILRQ